MFLKPPTRGRLHIFLAMPVRLLSLLLSQLATSGVFALWQIGLLCLITPKICRPDLPGRQGSLHSSRTNISRAGSLSGYCAECTRPRNKEVENLLASPRRA
ncbi:hypothetical protein BD626DRAFT_104481 [Schizophyllum amplum]|uniref:Uncharacterized protein n=1 Tax=Schizophyllum amplum TaxID=97359 RepID=A0A550CSB5_9AGAR|nr:hypothetical protein BD626DRAFT_104481 [Auriculariopsis ampla]